jgi:hypothetical protein
MDGVEWFETGSGGPNGPPAGGEEVGPVPSAAYEGRSTLLTTWMIPFDAWMSGTITSAPFTWTFFRTKPLLET